MVHLGRQVWSETYYILGAELRLFSNMSVWDLRHNSDHYLILGCLRSATLREHENYFGRCTWFPLWTLTTPTRNYRLFAALHQVISKLKALEVRKNVWISADMWRLVDTRLFMRRYSARDQGLL